MTGGGILRSGEAAEESISYLESCNLKRVFRILDVNGDNAICPRDLHKALCQKHILTRKKEVVDMIWECDDLGVGFIDFDAFCDIYCHVKDGGHEPKRFFSFILYLLFDRNDDGNVTPEELLTFAFPQMRPSDVATLVDSFTREDNPCSIPVGEFIRLMQSSAWGHKIGSEHGDSDTAPHRKLIKIAAKRKEAKAMYLLESTLRKASLEQESWNKKEITSSSLRKGRSLALLEAQVGPVKKVAKPQKEVLQLRRQRLPSVTPTASSERNAFLSQGVTMLKRESPSKVDYATFFLEENCLDRATREIRAAARDIGVDLFLAEKAHANFLAICTDGAGRLAAAEFMKFAQKNIFANAAPLNRLRSCWLEVSQSVTKRGQPMTVEYITFPQFLRWYSRRFNSDGLSTISPTEEMYASLGQDRIRRTASSINLLEAPLITNERGSSRRNTRVWENSLLRRHSGGI